MKKNPVLLIIALVLFLFVTYLVGYEKGRSHEAGEFEVDTILINGEWKTIQTKPVE